MARPTARWILLASALLVGTGGCGCEEDAAAEIEPVGAESTDTAAPAEPAARATAEADEARWAPRFVRKCSEWAMDVLFVEEGQLIACNGAVYDPETGELVDVREGVEHPGPAGDDTQAEDGARLEIAEGEARWLDGDGRVLATRSAPGHPFVLDTSGDGARLVSGDEGTELWRLEDGAIRTETVHPRRADDGVFAGPHIVLSLPPRTAVWLHRGEPGSLAELPPPEAPERFDRLEPDVDGDMPSFEGNGSIFGRDSVDVAAFDRRGSRFTMITVSRSDAGELARFEDDAAWARMAAARYVEPGARRWARRWRDEAGHRVVRGHSYIGGCERVHIDVRVVERDGVLERWMIYTADGEVDDVVGPIPEDAVEIVEARSDDYPGDPSIGPR